MFGILMLNDGFSAFDKQKLLHLTQLHPEDFSKVDLMALEIQLDTFIINFDSLLLLLSLSRAWLPLMISK